MLVAKDIKNISKDLSLYQLTAVYSLPNQFFADRYLKKPVRPDF